MSNVLAIGDTHAPAMKKGYPQWCRDIYDAWDCDTVVMMGDLVDNCALSFHLKKPCLKDPNREWDRALEQIEEITTLFPEAHLLIGNHDALPYRLCDELGIPTDMMKSFGDMFELPDAWTVTERFGQVIIDDIIYQHGDRGRGSARLNMQQEMKSVVQGHHHSKFSIEGAANQREYTYGMQVGCGVDWKHMSMEYGVKFNQKPILGCGVVIDGHPYLERWVY